jgi:lipoprotein-anchoring transpeptidase ErfK/SrfK
MRLFLIFIVTIIFLLGPLNVAWASQKRIDVDLTAQQLTAFEDEKVLYNFTISSGKPWTPTPTGEFKPYVKLPSTRMRGPGYNLPNVPYTVYFFQGYALHGTYWHNNFGRPMSHGCVNLRTPDMALLYSWIDMETKIRIYGTTPRG